MKLHKEANRMRRMLDNDGVGAELHTLAPKDIHMTYKLMPANDDA